MGESFKPCEQEDPKSLCVGRAYRAYFYEFRDKQNFSYQIPVGGGYGESYMFYIYPVFTSPEVSRVIRRSLPVGCQKAVDIAFVIDTSGSVKQVNFNKVIQFLKMFVDRFDFPDSGTR